MTQRNYQGMKRKSPTVIFTLEEESPPAKKQTTLTGISETKKILNAAVEKIKPVDFRLYIESVIGQIGTKSKKTKVGVFGRTGVGKSYLINTILGENLLPSGSGSACTSGVIQVEANTRDSNFIAELEFISEQEWEQELKSLRQIVDEGTEKYEQSVVDSAKDKIKAVYGKDGIKKTLEQLKSERIPELGGKKEESHETAENLEAAICDYVGSGQSNSSGRFYWPLMKSVTIKVPGHNDILENLVLIDLPGTGDVNKSRQDVWKKYVRECTTVWIISDINRAVSDQSSWEILSSHLKDLALGGECSSICYICTMTDDMNAEEYMRNKKLKDEDLGIKQQQLAADYKKMKSRACIVHRNKQSKEVIEEAFGEKIQDHFCCDVGFKVFTVSSKEFRDPDKLSDAELTEIPALRELLRDLNASFPDRREEEYIKEAEGVLSLIQGSKCDRHTDAEIKNTKRQAYRKLKETLTANLSEALRGKYNALEDCLSQAAKESEANCLQNAEEKVIDPTDIENASGYHKTLRAMCVKGGVTISKNTGKVTDLNAVLVSHMEQKVNQTFKDVFERSSRQTQSVTAILQKFDLTSQITKEFKPPVTLILTFIATQQDKRKTALDEYITEMRKEIFNCLNDTIESAMDPVYREAASHTGPGSYAEMQEVLRESIRKLKSTMFTQAMLNALEKFDSMEDHIEKTLKELQDIAAKALSQKHSMSLPDISDEINRMTTLREERKRRP